MAPTKEKYPRPGQPPPKPPDRVDNAKALRKNFITLKHTPGGNDFNPLTMPNCVECGHCGFPVYPRDCKAATKKTFRRAGLEEPGTERRDLDFYRDKQAKEDEAAKKREEERAARIEAGEDPDDIDEEMEEQEELEAEENASETNTIDRLEEENDLLKEKNQELEEQNKELTEKNIYLTGENERLEKELADALERIEVLEELEERWREKYAIKSQEWEHALWVIEGKAFRIKDLESAVVKFAGETYFLREQTKKRELRRSSMLGCLDRELERRENYDLLMLVVREWASWAGASMGQARFDRCQALAASEKDDLVQRLDEVEFVAMRDGFHLDRLVSRNKAAAQRFLMRTCSSAYPWHMFHAMKAWIAVHPLVFTENVLERTEVERDEYRRQRDDLQTQLTVLQAAHDKLTADNYQLGLDYAELQAKSRMAMEVIAQAKIQKEKDDKKISELETDLANNKELLQQMEEEMAEKLAEMAAMGNVPKADTGPGTPKHDPSLVVQKECGVLCVGCLRQLLHRSVAVLPPLDAMKAKEADLVSARQGFFDAEMNGALDPNDSVHNAAYKSHRDPYHIAKLSRFPMGEPRDLALAKVALANSTAMAQDCVKAHKGLSELVPGIPAQTYMRGSRSDGKLGPLVRIGGLPSRRKEFKDTWR